MRLQALFRQHCAHCAQRRALQGQLRSRQAQISTQCSGIRRVTQSLRSKQKSARDVLEEHLQQVNRTESTYHSFLKVDIEGAKSQVTL